MGSQKNIARALLFSRRSKTIFRNSRFAILYEEKRFNIEQLIFIININITFIIYYVFYYIFFLFIMYKF